MRRNCSQFLARGRHGAAALELALTLPVLLLAAFGCVDMGRAASAHLVVCNAARTGADYAATRGVTSFTRDTWEAAIRADVEAEMQSVPDFDSSRLSVQIETTPGDFDLDCIRVTVQYQFETITGWPGIPQTIALEHSVCAQRFR